MEYIQEPEEKIVSSVSDDSEEELSEGSKLVLVQLQAERDLEKLPPKKKFKKAKYNTLMVF